MTTHDQWDELAAGYALHALEPDEELRFTEHLAGCAECAASLRDHDLVAAQLGSLAHSDEDVPAPGWNTLRGSIVGTAAPVSLEDHRRTRARRQPWLLGAAAAAVLIAGAGVAVWQTQGTSTTPAARAISACEHRTGCSVIRLHASSGAEPGAVLVSGDRVTMVPLAMQAPPAGKQYVLWQVLRSGAPTPINGFRSASDTSSAPLVMSYADTAAFAVSLETTTWPPSQPSKLLAIGNTSA